MTGSLPRVSIILPCRNERDFIVRTLTSIFRQESTAGGFEVIVADGMSDDGTRALLEQMAKTEPRLKIADNPNRIVSSGLNAALAMARGDVIIRMDAHTEFAPDYVLSCLEVLEETGADNVGGPWVARGSGQVGRAIAAAFQSPFAVGGARGHDPSYEGRVDTVYLGCWPRRVFDQIGLFDEVFVRNQDDEFNLRLTSHGGRICQSPRIRSWYMPRNSLPALFNQYKQYGYWKVRVIQKHQKPASFRHLVPAAFLCSLVVLGAASFWSSPAGAAWGMLTGAYLTAIAIFSLLTASVHGWKTLPFLPFVFATYHLGYGYGFARGVVDFFILRRTPPHAYTDLTRRADSNTAQAKPPLVRVD